MAKEEEIKWQNYAKAMTRFYENYMEFSFESSFGMQSRLFWFVVYYSLFINRVNRVRLKNMRIEVSRWNQLCAKFKNSNDDKTLQNFGCDRFKVIFRFFILCDTSQCNFPPKWQNIFMQPFNHHRNMPQKKVFQFFRCTSATATQSQSI